MNVKELVGAFSVIVKTDGSFAALVTREQLYTLSRQVVLVAGGAGDAGLLASTEILTGGSWRPVGALPAAVRGLRGAALHGAVFMSGAGHSVRTLGDPCI